MSVIAYKQGVMAADKRAVDSYGVITVTTKLFKREGLGVLGVAGKTNDCLRVRAWFLEGHPFPKNIDVDFMILTEDGVCKVYRSSMCGTVVEGPYAAIGSGSDYAIAAMDLGEGAVAAVLFASKFVSNCGNGVDVYVRASPNGESSHE